MNNSFGKYPVADEVEMTQEMMIDLLSTAFEGGIGYWSQYICSSIADMEPDQKKVFQDLGPSYAVAPVFRAGWIRIGLMDPDTSKTVEGKTIFREDLVLGLTRMRVEYPERLRSILQGQYDAEDADVFMQLVVFGEVIYG